MNLITHTLDVVAKSGVAFRLRLTVDEIPKRTKVTFFYRKANHSRNGQLIGVYYADSLMQSTGVYLTSSDEDIDSSTYGLILDWLRMLVDRGVFKI